MRQSNLAKENVSKTKNVFVIKRMKIPKGSDTSTLKILSEVFSGIENAKDKMLEADLNLGRRMTICQGIRKIFAQYYKL